MVSEQSVKDQMKKLGFNHTGWGRTEMHELHKILLPDEEIYEAVNGFYEGGFAMLLATDIRVLLVDKKPLNYLTVEDLRFDMINEMDYNHRVIGANISIATGNKTLKFTSLNQPRLRKLISHVQHSMAQTKKQVSSHAEEQKGHLEQINLQLQAYLVAQHQNQLRIEEIQRAQLAGATPPPLPDPVKPSPELSDFLYAQSLLAQYNAQTRGLAAPTAPVIPLAPRRPVQMALSSQDVLQDGLQEVFGKVNRQTFPQPAPMPAPQPIHIPYTNIAIPSISSIPNPLEINPMRIAYSKLPMALRNRKFGRPSFHAHSDSGLEPSIPNLPPQPAEI